MLKVEMHSKAYSDLGCVLFGLLTRSDLEQLAREYKLDMIESD